MSARKITDSSSTPYSEAFSDDASTLFDDASTLNDGVSMLHDDEDDEDDAIITDSEHDYPSDGKLDQELSKGKFKSISTMHILLSVRG